MTDQRYFLPFGGATLVLFSLLVGCSTSEWGATVSGQVTLDDKPLTSGNVSFHPQAGGAVAYGAIRTSGRFQLKTGSQAGLVPGEYIVTVVASKLPPPTEEDPEPAPVLLTPEMYGDVKTSGLRVTIESGSNDVPLQLVTKKNSDA